MMKKIHLLWAFYLNFAAALLVVNGVSLYTFYKVGMNSLTIILCLKVLSAGAIVIYISSYKKKDFYYYQNRGLSRSFLWKYTLSADMISLILLLFLTAQLP